MDIVYAIPDPGVYIDGYLVMRGQHWSATDPIVARYPELFSPDARHGLFSSTPVEVDIPVERASAAPGERRAARRR